MSSSYRTKLWFLRMISLLMMMNLSGCLTDQVKKGNIGYIQIKLSVLHNPASFAISQLLIPGVLEEGYSLSCCICSSVESCVWEKSCRQSARTLIYVLKLLPCSITNISIFKHACSFRRHHRFQTVLHVCSNAYKLRAGTCSSNITCVPGLCESWITIQGQNTR